MFDLGYDYSLVKLFALPAQTCMVVLAGLCAAVLQRLLLGSRIMGVACKGPQAKNRP